jgi:hypothetical protein
MSLMATDLRTKRKYTKHWAFIINPFKPRGNCHTYPETKKFFPKSSSVKLGVTVVHNIKHVLYMNIFLKTEEGEGGSS